MLDAADRHVRLNGISDGISRLQLLSWVSFLSFVVSFYTVFLAGVNVGARAAAGTAFGVFAVLSAGAAGVATCTDPRDSLDAQAHSTGFYCPRCEKAVKKESKHCGICHKCIDVFDRACPLFTTSHVLCAK
jgi:hypothetical protein